MWRVVAREDSCFLSTTILTAELQPQDLIPPAGAKQRVVEIGHLDIPNVLSLLVCFPIGFGKWWSKRPGYLDIIQLISSCFWSPTPCCSGEGWTRRSWLSGHTPGQAILIVWGSLIPLMVEIRNNGGPRTPLISLPHYCCWVLFSCGGGG